MPKRKKTDKPPVAPTTKELPQKTVLTFSGLLQKAAPVSSGRTLTPVQRLLSKVASQAYSGPFNNLSVLGIDPDSIETQKVTLVTLVIDDSGSLRQFLAELRSAVAAAISQLKEVRSSSTILVCVITLNRGVLVPFTKVTELPDIECFSNGGTPLYDIAYDTVAVILAKSQQLKDAGIPTRTQTLLFTDGKDESSERQTASDVSALIAELIEQPKNIFWGIALGPVARQSLSEMGIPEETLKSSSDPIGLKAAFLEFSQATAAVSSI